MPNEELVDLTQRQRDRLAFVELRVRFIGEIRRQDLVSRFSIQSAAATRDLTLYKELVPGKLNWIWCRTQTHHARKLSRWTAP